MEVSDRYGVRLLKSIRKLWVIVNNRISFFVGNERRVKFWKDKWCGNEFLCMSFPSLFALTSSKEAWGVDLGNQSNVRGCWTPSFFKHLND